MKRFREVIEIPLDQLVIGKTQVRTREVGRDIDELAESIRKVGLLEPIVVAPSVEKPGTYEIITGQRRFLAHKEIGAASILAAVLEESVSETEAKVLSLTENLLRRDLNNRDLIDCCTFLFKKYGSLQDVAKETGLPYSRVSEYVRYDRLIPELRTVVDAGQVRIKDALRAQDAAAAASGKPDTNLAVRLAQEMATMSGAQQDRLIKERIENPSRPIDEVIEEQKTSKKVVQIVVTLSATSQERLQAYAREESTTQDDAARALIEEGLALKGFREATD